MNKYTFISWLQRQWYNQEFGLWHILTWPFEQLYRRLSRLKQVQDLAQAEGPNVPVIIVGNIHVGGMGKSPIVQALALALAQRNRSVGVLLRGYKARGTENNWPLRVYPYTSPVLAGDESVMHAQAFQQYSHQLDVDIITVVDPDRARGAAYLEQLGASIIICDDGLQHYRLLRDCEIVVMNGAKGAGRGHLLPAGPLREPLSRLLDVDLLLSPCGLTVDLMQQVPLVENNLWLYELQTSMPQPLWAGVQSMRAAHLCGSESIVAIAGIGQPDGFFSSLTGYGYRINTCVFPDHYNYTLEDVQQLAVCDQPIVMTAKDAVKIAALLTSLDILTEQWQLNQEKAQSFKILNFCRWAYVLPYKAILEEALIDRVLSVALDKYEQRRKKTET